MISIDSLYESIVSGIEKDLPISVNRPQKRRAASFGAENTNGAEETEKKEFKEVLQSASSDSVKAIDPRSIMTRIETAIMNAAKKYNIDYELIKGVVKAESSFDPNSVSNVGAMGLMQLMPGTASSLGVTDAFNIEQNIEGGTKYLRQMLDRFNGDISLALAAYNAGPANVEKYGGIPPFDETQNYVPRVLSNMENYKKG